MCRWLSYSGTPIHLEKLLFDPLHTLIEQSLHARKAKVATNGDGFGVGWYADRPTPGIYRDVLPAWNDTNLKSLAHQIRSNLFFAHVRASTGTATSRDNCHPFHYRQWLFMHNGQIGGYNKVRRRLDALIPDALYEHRHGTTDSELFFILMIHFGLIDDPIGALKRTLAVISEEMRRAEIEEPFRMTAAFSDGVRVFAVRHASDPNPPSLYWSVEGGDTIIVSEPLDEVRGHWKQVPPSHVLISEPGGKAKLRSLSAC